MHKDIKLFLTLSRRAYIFTLSQELEEFYYQKKFSKLIIRPEKECKKSYEKIIKIEKKY